MTTSAPATLTRRSPVGPATFGRQVAGEWIKARSLRSTWWVLALGTALLPAFAVSRMASIAQVPEAVGSESLVGAAYATSGVALAQLAFAVLGVLAIAGEYGSGQIRTTLTVVPARTTAITAKLLVTVGMVVLAAAFAVALSWALCAAWFDQTGMSIDLTRAEDARIMLGAPLYLGAITALAFGIAAVVRSSVAGIAIVLGLLLVVENLLAVIPWSPLQDLAAYLPSSAGSRLLLAEAAGSVITASNSTLLGPWVGFAVLLGWSAALLVVAGVLLRRRDV